MEITLTQYQFRDDVSRDIKSGNIVNTDEATAKARLERTLKRIKSDLEDEFHNRHTVGNLIRHLTDFLQDKSHEPIRKQIKALVKELHSKTATTGTLLPEEIETTKKILDAVSTTTPAYLVTEISFESDNLSDEQVQALYDALDKRLKKKK